MRGLVAPAAGHTRFAQRQSDAGTSHGRREPAGLNLLGLQLQLTAQLGREKTGGQMAVAPQPDAQGQTSAWRQPATARRLNGQWQGHRAFLHDLGLNLLRIGRHRGFLLGLGRRLARGHRCRAGEFRHLGTGLNGHPGHLQRLGRCAAHGHPETPQQQSALVQPLPAHGVCAFWRCANKASRMRRIAVGVKWMPSSALRLIFCPWASRP